MATILLVDDDPALREILGTYLRRNGYDVEAVESGAHAEEVLSHTQPDLILLDIMLPGDDGWDFLRSVRQRMSVPVIVVTGKSTEHDILQGFTLGADDYVTKPFSFAQLEARINARLANSDRPTAERANVLTYDDLVIDLNSRRVLKGNRLIVLTPTEFRLLAALVNSQGTVLTSDQIVTQVWGPQYAGVSEYIRRYIWHLRRKLEDDPHNPRYIRNERNWGYYFGPAAGAMC